MQKTQELIELFKYKGWIQNFWFILRETVIADAFHSGMGILRVAEYHGSDIRCLPTSRILDSQWVFGCSLVNSNNSINIFGWIDNGIFYGRINSNPSIADYRANYFYNIRQATKEQIRYGISQLSWRVKDVIIQSIIPSAENWENSTADNPLRDWDDGSDMVTVQTSMGPLGIETSYEVGTHFQAECPFVLKSRVIELFQEIFQDYSRNSPKNILQSYEEFDQFVDALLYLMQ